MTTRKNSRRTGSLDRVLETLPERFLAPVATVVDGDPIGLINYMRDLTAHLEAQTGQEGQTVEAMTALGIPPSRWYEAMMS